jgi:hypothetical protein
MKQRGQCLTGDPIRIDRFTTNWLAVKLHPTTFYRRLEEFQSGFELVKGLYAEIDCGQYVSVRFSEKDDLTAFYRRHHAYL